jgi:hypothetical protein
LSLGRLKKSRKKCYDLTQLVLADPVVVALRCIPHPVVAIDRPSYSCAILHKKDGQPDGKVGGMKTMYKGRLSWVSQGPKYRDDFANGFYTYLHTRFIVKSTMTTFLVVSVLSFILGSRSKVQRRYC